MFNRCSKHAQIRLMNASRRIFETSFQPKDIQRGSVVVSECVPVVRDLSGFDVEKRLPLPEDYTLKALLDAGVPLKEVSVMNQVSDRQINGLLSELDSTFVEPAKVE